MAGSRWCHLEKTVISIIFHHLNTLFLPNYRPKNFRRHLHLLSLPHHEVFQQPFFLKKLNFQKPSKPVTLGAARPTLKNFALFLFIWFDGTILLSITQSFTTTNGRALSHVTLTWIYFQLPRLPRSSLNCRRLLNINIIKN